MSRFSYHSEVWRPFREMMIMGVLCVIMPMVLVSQMIGLLYAAPLA